jgi:hypothetical protein
MKKSKPLFARSTPTNQPSADDHLFNEQFHQILQAAALSLANRQRHEQALNERAAAAEFTALTSLDRRTTT